MMFPILTLGDAFLVRCRIPLADLREMSLPTTPPRFKDGWVRVGQEPEALVFTWVNRLDQPRVVWSQAESLRLAAKMGQVVSEHLRCKNLQHPSLALLP